MKRQTRRRRQTLRRRRQRGGVDRRKIAAALSGLATLSADAAKEVPNPLSQVPKGQTETLYDLGAKWWNEGTFESSQKFADGIVAAFQGLPGEVAERATDLANSIRKDIPVSVPTAEPGYTATMPTFSVEPTKLPPSVVSNVDGVTVGETYMFVPKNGGDTVTAMIMEHTELGNWHSIPEISPSKWDDYTVYGPLPPEKEDDEDWGGRRRKPRRKTIRKKK